MGASGGADSSIWEKACVMQECAASRTRGNGVMRKVELRKSFLVDGEFKSCQKSAATAFSRPRRGSLDMRRCLPGRLVGLAAMWAVIANRFWLGF